MTDRSKQIEIRNPVMGLKGTGRLLALPTRQQVFVRDILKEMAADAAQRAEKCWRTRKAPMAAYWKAVSVYAGHFARAIGRRPGGTEMSPARFTAELLAEACRVRGLHLVKTANLPGNRGLTAWQALAQEMEKH